jgi:hypothetical protein
MRVRGRSSGVGIDSEAVHVWEFIEGRAARMQIYADRQRALDEFGLEG